MINDEIGKRLDLGNTISQIQLDDENLVTWNDIVSWDMEPNIDHAKIEAALEAEKIAAFDVTSYLKEEALTEADNIKATDSPTEVEVDNDSKPLGDFTIPLEPDSSLQVESVNEREDADNFILPTEINLPSTFESNNKSDETVNSSPPEEIDLPAEFKNESAADEVINFSLPSEINIPNELKGENKIDQVVNFSQPTEIDIPTEPNGENKIDQVVNFSQPTEIDLPTELKNEGSTDEPIHYRSTKDIDLSTEQEPDNYTDDSSPEIEIPAPLSFADYEESDPSASITSQQDDDHVFPEKTQSKAGYFDREKDLEFNALLEEVLEAHNEQAVEQVEADHVADFELDDLEDEKSTWNESSEVESAASIAYEDFDSTELDMQVINDVNNTGLDGDIEVDSNNYSEEAIKTNAPSLTDELSAQDLDDIQRALDAAYFELTRNGRTLERLEKDALNLHNYIYTNNYGQDDADTSKNIEDALYYVNNSLHNTIQSLGNGAQYEVGFNDGAVGLANLADELERDYNMLSILKKDIHIFLNKFQNSDKEGDKIIIYNLDKSLILLDYVEKSIDVIINHLQFAKEKLNN